MKSYEGSILIPFTVSSLTGRLAEVRDKLDRWLATIPKPPRAMAQVLRMKAITGHSVTYELTIRDRVADEARTIL